jgi:hypothetical protein
VATSSSANKVAKLASRGKGKKVRFQSGTTFPLIVAIALISMIALIAYSKATVPGIETGAPQPSDAWSMAYGIRICDEQLPPLTGTAAELKKAEREKAKLFEQEETKKRLQAELGV